MVAMIDVAAVRRRYEAVSPVLDERVADVFAAAEALTAGWDCIAAVAEATGIARSTIGYGLRELRGQAPDWPFGEHALGTGAVVVVETAEEPAGDLQCAYRNGRDQTHVSRRISQAPLRRAGKRLL